MSNKVLACFYTEGATDKVFYNNLLNYMRTLSQSHKFSVDKVEKQDIKGIGNFQNKLIRKFKSEILPYKETHGYILIVFLCYDKDVFDLNKQPPIDREKLEKNLIEAGADKVIHIVANRSIEDVFLTDEKSIIKSLKLKNKDLNGIVGTGYEKLKTIYKKANKIYYKGDTVEDFVSKLDMAKICCVHCTMFSPICNELFEDLSCPSKKS